MMRTELTVDQMNQVNGGEEAELVNNTSSDIEQILDKVTPTYVKEAYNTVKTTAGTIFFYGKTFLDRIF